MDNSQFARPWAGRFSNIFVNNRYVIGDVHGCSKTLRIMVEDVIRLGSDDTLFMLGDYIDRGPDSKGVLDYLTHLILEKDYDVRPLRGNHEQMCLDAVSEPAARDLWYGNWGLQTVRQFGVNGPEEIPKRYLDFMAAMPLIRTTMEHDYVFVHAGLDFRAADPIWDTSPQFMLWERDFRIQPEKLKGHTLVCGHTMTPLFEIRASLDKPVICLDNGCYDKGHIGFGNLVALNLDTRELLVVENCE
jgi:serine/threonine protein phosphatase 1